MKEYDMFPNIINHSVQVKRVALAITDNLLATAHIDRELVLASALLHDIAKTRTIKTGEIRHDLIGADMMRDMGFPAIAGIIEVHVVMLDFKPDGPLEEREIVYYADKRVMHDKIVTIDERIKDISCRYSKYVSDPAIIEKSRVFVHSMENKIIRWCSRNLEEIISEL